ncbi:MAG: hypothetical protein ACXVZI_04265 [Terriglobales bacterium]
MKSGPGDAHDQPFEAMRLKELCVHSPSAGILDEAESFELLQENVDG